MKTLFILFALLAPSLAFAQPAVDWSKIAGGAGTSTGGVYQISGTIGQPDAGAAMAGGGYSMTGGFWSFISVVQTPGAPTLTISYSGSSVVISWPYPSTGFTLQQNNNVALPGGWTASGYSVSTANGTNSISFVPPAGNLFFRLVNPE